jgi:hypothetical protein
MSLNWGYGEWSLLNAMLDSFFVTAELKTW